MTPASSPDFEQAQAQVQALDALLAEEFEALRAQSFDALESLQPRKMALLESLAAVSGLVRQQPEPPPPAWQAVVDSLARCRDSWRRNEQLVQRQLEVVRTALRSLQAADAPPSVELYDRLGQTSRRLGSRIFSEA